MQSRTQIAKVSGADDGALPVKMMKVTMKQSCSAGVQFGHRERREEGTRERQAPASHTYQMGGNCHFFDSASRCP